MIYCILSDIFGSTILPAVVTMTTRSLAMFPDDYPWEINGTPIEAALGGGSPEVRTPSPDHGHFGNCPDPMSFLLGENSAA